MNVIISNFSDNKNNESCSKWHLVQEILRRPFEGRRLIGVDLSGTDLSGADLSSADLSGADLGDTVLRGANLIHANLWGTNLSGVIIDNGTKIDSKWHLVWKIVNRKAYGRGLSRTNLIEANLRGVYLYYADLRNAYLNGANLTEANLQEAKLRGATLTEANLTNANLRGADLTDANLTRVDLRGADLTDVNLTYASVEKALFGYNQGISEEMRCELIARKAIFIAQHNPKEDAVHASLPFRRSGASVAAS